MNVTFRRFCVTIVAVEKQYVLHILSVCLCVFKGLPYSVLSVFVNASF